MVPSLTKNVTHLLCTETDFEKLVVDMSKWLHCVDSPPQSSKVTQAISRHIPIVSEDFLDACIASNDWQGVDVSEFLIGAPPRRREAFDISSDEDVKPPPPKKTKVVALKKIKPAAAMLSPAISPAATTLTNLDPLKAPKNVAVPAGELKAVKKGRAVVDAHCSMVHACCIQFYFLALIPVLAPIGLYLSCL